LAQIYLEILMRRWRRYGCCISDWLGVASLEMWRVRKWQKSVVSVIVSASLRKRHDRLVANLLQTCWQLPHLRGSYGETGVMDFGL